MKRRNMSIFVVMLLILAIYPLTASGGDEDNPEIKDRRRDVKLFGIIGGLPQFYFKHIDIISGWFYEEIDEPNYLFVSLKLRELQDKSETFEALYSVSWIYNHKSYQTIVKIHSDGIYGSFYVIDDDDTSHGCEGTLDTENNIISWKIPKNLIGNPQPQEVLTTTAAYALLRLYNDGKVGADLFKDLTNRLIGGPPSERYGENYKIKY